MTDCRNVAVWRGGGYRSFRSRRQQAGTPNQCTPGRGQLGGSLARAQARKGNPNNRPNFFADSGRTYMKVSKLMATSALVGGLALFSAATYAAEEVEVLHWWTSGAEAAALNVLKQDLEKAGVGWQDVPVAGGGGEQAMTALRARVTAGNPPTAVQMLGFDITDWAKQGVVADLSDLAGKEGWDAVVPPRIAGVLQIRRQVDRGPGQRALDQLGVGQQGDLRQARPEAAHHLGRADRRARQDQGGRLHGGRPWRPALAGSHDLRRGRDVDRRSGVLQEGVHRPGFRRRSAPTPWCRRSTE